MSKLPLIAITRTAQDNHRLAGLLEAPQTYTSQISQACQVCRVPLLRFELCGQGMAEAQSVLRTYRGWIILTSPQAARAFLQSCSNCSSSSHNPPLHDTSEPTELPTELLKSVQQNCAIAAVGVATARVLQEVNCRVDFIPTRAEARYLAAELPYTPMHETPTHEIHRVLHLTSQLADDTLQDGVQARGFAYQRLVLYKTLPREPEPTECDILIKADVVTLASASAARQLACVLRRVDPEAFARVWLAVIGAKTARAAHEEGFVHIRQAEQPSLESLASVALELGAAVRSIASIRSELD